MFNRIIVALMQVSEKSYVKRVRKDGNIFYVKMENGKDKVSANMYFLNSMRVTLFTTCISVALWFFSLWFVLLTVGIFLIGWGISATIRYWVYMDCDSDSIKNDVLRHSPKTIGYYMVEVYRGFNPVFILKMGRNLRFEIVSDKITYSSEEDFLEQTKNKPKSSTESVEIKSFPTEADASEQQ